MAENSRLREQLAVAQQRLDWFQRQLFGHKSEKQLEVDPSVPMSLLAGLADDTPPKPTVGIKTKTVERRRKVRDACVNETGLRFDDSVSVCVIEVSATEGSEGGEVIAYHSMFRLVQWRASYEVLE